MHKCILLLVLRFLCWTHDRLLPLFVAFFTMESGWNPKIRVTRGRCYDHNFLRFSPMFLKTNVMIQFLPKLAVFRTKKHNFFTKCCCENIFKSWQMSLTGRNFTTGKNQLKLPTYVKSSTIFKTGFIVYITFLKYGSVLSDFGRTFQVALSQNVAYLVRRQKKIYGLETVRRKLTMRTLFWPRVTRDRCFNYFCNFLVTKLAFLTQSKGKLFKILIITSVFEKNANFFAQSIWPTFCLVTSYVYVYCDKKTGWATL
jgi:hypothetical protein